MTDTNRLFRGNTSNKALKNTIFVAFVGFISFLHPIVTIGPNPSLFDLIADIFVDVPDTDPLLDLRPDDRDTAFQSLLKVGNNDTRFGGTNGNADVIKALQNPLVRWTIPSIYQAESDLEC